MPGAPVGRGVPVHPGLLHRRVRALLRRTAERRQDALPGASGRVPRRHRRRDGGCRRSGHGPSGRTAPAALLRRHLGAADRLRARRRGHRRAPGGSKALGRSDVRCRSAAGPARQHQLGPGGDGPHRSRPAAVGPPPAARCGPAARSRDSHQAVSGAVPRPAAGAVPAGRADAGLRGHRGRGGADAGPGQSAGLSQQPVLRGEREWRPDGRGRQSDRPARRGGPVRLGPDRRARRGAGGQRDVPLLRSQPGPAG